jgi:hypothetical protein
MNSRKLSSIYILLFMLSFQHAEAQRKENMDEAKVGAYILPNVLSDPGGKSVKNYRQWEKWQRPLILSTFATYMYGRWPDKKALTQYEVIRIDSNAFDGKAIRKEVVIRFIGKSKTIPLHVLIYQPKIEQRPPVFISLNFQGNHSTQKDTTITITESWRKLNKNPVVIERGGQERRWPIKEIIEGGFAIATAWYQELEEDRADGWRTGIREELKDQLNTAPEEWTALGVWGWGMSRILDYIETDRTLDAEKVIALGHSRLGKATLWGAANDRRFAAVISNNSGEGGAALSRREFGENIARINTSFPHWFVAKFKEYNGRPQDLPVDQHMLLSLIAPRPLYVASASLDLWADPKGEFISATEAGKVYALYGKEGIKTPWSPTIGETVGKTVRYHIREGTHDILLFDWVRYMQFAKETL